MVLNKVNGPPVGLLSLLKRGWYALLPKFSKREPHIVILPRSVGQSIFILVARFPLTCDEQYFLFQRSQNRKRPLPGDFCINHRVATRLLTIMIYCPRGR